MIKSKIMRWAGHVASMCERRDVYSFLVGKPEGRKPLGRPRRRREDKIKIWTVSSWFRIGTGSGHL